MTLTKTRLANAARLAFVAIVGSAIIAAPGNSTAALFVLLAVIATSLLFGWLKKKWKRGTRDFERIMEEELGR
jgi:molybdopterin biosynthesis enzyme